MKLSFLCLPLLALAALCGGCADTYPQQTRAMGANAATGTVCRDGYVLPINSGCALHGGPAPAVRR